MRGISLNAATWLRLWGLYASGDALDSRAWMRKFVGGGAILWGVGQSSAHPHFRLEPP